MMNVINKLLTFAHAQLVTQLTDDTPEHVNYLYGFILWMFLPLIALIPAFLVKEDLRRLNMKDVQKSNYVEEKTILQLHDNPEKRLQFIRDHHIIADDEVLKTFELIIRPQSVAVRQTESLLDQEQSLRLKSNRLSDQSIKSNKPLIKVTKAKPKYVGEGSEFSQKLELMKSGSLKNDPFEKKNKKGGKQIGEDDDIFDD